jgi:hypothetical protein
VVDHAEAAQRVAVPGDQRSARIEADLILAEHERVVDEALVLGPRGPGKLRSPVPVVQWSPAGIRMQALVN